MMKVLGYIKIRVRRRNSTERKKGKEKEQERGKKKNRSEERHKGKRKNPIKADMADSQRESVQEDEPDLSDDEGVFMLCLCSGNVFALVICMGAGLNFETPEEIQRIQIEADGDGGTGTPNEPVADSAQKSNSRSTSSLLHHARGGCKEMPRSKRMKPDALQRLLTLDSAEGQPKPSVWEFEQKRSRKNLAYMVIGHEYPFNSATHHFFKVFATDLQPLFKMPARTTLRTDCMGVYEEEKLKLYELFGRMDCKVSFTSDLWTCKGKDRGFMALTCHYIDDDWKLRKRLLTFTPMPSPHTGKHISEAIYDKLVLWNLDKKTFSLVLDNASANDAAIRDLLSKSHFRKNLPCDGQIFHLRCGCHILNLIVQDGLSVMSGKIDAIRETMKYIRHSQSRMEKFKFAASQVNAPDKKPAWDVQTRWNSTYIMLDLALQLKDAIIRYAEVDKSYTFCPSDLEWDHVKALHGSAYPFIVKMGKEMFHKWNKYWEIGSVLLAIACCLDPRCKLAVVEYYFKMMHPEELESFMTNLKNCFDDLFNEYLISNNKASQTQSQSAKSTDASSSGSKGESDTRAGLKNFLNDKKQADPQLSELDQYIAEPLDPCSLDDDFDILSWWKLKAPKFPVLSKLARDVLAVPISTVASESTFSTAGRTLSPTRSSLNDESIEALVCAQNWLRTAVIESGGELGDENDDADATDEIVQ
ncbi:hypothetical protein LUZ61_017795 [Rhynchospora tenuis]|uniref:Transposase n=1 Tax=Rhynchospora tenuis TaxID=198213 RepID=A0AAD5Z886_9POAL|nr:hypothetical protein LUZ61_017795 [Rhynchospora tenuis]